MTRRFATRARDLEHLDAPKLDPAILATALRQIASVNKWLGGARAVLRYLDPLFDVSRSLSVLDVGTGGADIPRLVACRAERRGRAVTILAFDCHQQVAQFAQAACTGSPAISVAVGAGQRLPLRAGAVDIAMSSMTLHHLTDERSIDFVRELGRVARRAVIVSDLERHPINYVGARMLASTVWRRNRYTREDGPLSVLRGFVAHELLSIGERAGLCMPVVHRSFPFRLVLVGQPGGAD